MSGSTSSVYNPLDKSQIAFIPNDFDSLNESITESGVDIDSQLEKEIYNSANLFSKDDAMSSTASIGSHSLYSTGPMTNDSRDDVEHLSKVPTRNSLNSNISDSVRYKIVLKLSPREIHLIRDSWVILLNDDVPSSKISSFFRKMIGKSSIGNRSSNNLGSTKALTNESKTTSNLQPDKLTGTASEMSIKSAQQTLNAGTSSIVTTRTIATSLFGSQFYANLLELDPNLEKIFPSIKHQSVAFDGVLTTAINNLENLTVLENYLNNLGKRHARILGVDPPQFELMGVAFIKTIQNRFGVHSTVELEETWAKLYSYLANSILQFGIDPVLRIDPISNNVTFPIPRLTESISSAATNTPLHDNPEATRIPTNTSKASSSRPFSISRKTPLSNNPKTKLSTLPSSNLPPTNSSTTSIPMPEKNKSTKLENEGARPKNILGRRNKQRGGGVDNEKDCVIM